MNRRHPDYDDWVIDAASEPCATVDDPNADVADLVRGRLARKERERRETERAAKMSSDELYGVAS